LASLNHDDQILRETFSNKANEDGKIDTNDMDELLEELSELLGVDCKQAKEVFGTPENQEKPKNGSPSKANLLGYFEFMGLLEIWLQKEADLNNTQTNTNANENHLLEQLSEIPAPTLTEYQTTETDAGVAIPTLPSNYQRNRALMNEILIHHRNQFEDMFQKKVTRAGDQEEGEEESENKLPVLECFALLKEFLGVANIGIKERIDKEEDFFRSKDCNKKLMNVTSRYFMNIVGEGPDFNVEEATIDYNQIFDMLDFFFRIDDNVVLIDNRNDDKSDVNQTRKALLATIAKYEKMITESTNEIENQVLKGTVESLKKKLQELEDQLNSDREALNEDARRKRAEKRSVVLKEIFDFYCAQQLNAGRYSTFVRIDRLSNTMNIGTFTVFLKSFRLKLDPIKIIELYKRAAGTDDNLEFSEFEALLNKISLICDLAAEEKPHEPRPEIRKEYKPDSYKKDLTYKKKREEDAKRREELTMNDYLKKAQNVYVVDAKRDIEKSEEVWEHMGLYNGGYRNNIGMVSLPFNSIDKENFRIPPGSLKYKYRTIAMDGKTVEEINEEVFKRNEMRKLVKDLKEVEKETISNYRATSLPPKNDFKNKLPKEDHPSYGNRQTFKRTKTNVGGGGKGEGTQLTMKKIGEMKTEQLKKVDAKFDPADLIDDNDDEDDIYLAEYSIDTDKKAKYEEKDNTRFENYGKLKRGVAVNGRYGRGPPSPMKHSLDYGSSPHSASYIEHHKGGFGSYLESPRHQMPSKLLPNSMKNTKNLNYMKQSLDYDYSPTNKKSNLLGSQPKIPSNPQVSSHGYQSQGHGHQGQEDYYNAHQGYYKNYPHHNYASQPQNPGYYNSMLGRANQIEYELLRREQQMLNNLSNIQSNQMKKGYKVVGK